MSTPLSFCDVSARYGRTPAPRRTPAEQTGWNSNQLFNDFMLKFRKKREEDREDAREDALMAVIDAMNDPERAGRAVPEEDAGRADPARSLPVRVILSVLGGRAAFEEADGVLERQERGEQKAGEERLEVTQARGLGSPSDPNSMERR